MTFNEQEIKSEIDQFYQATCEFADIARRVLTDSLGCALGVTRKTDKSLVTRADIEIERVLREEIAERFPSHGVIGEEFPDHLPYARYKWILDPIDGTEELVFGLPTFGCIISLERDGKAIASLIDHPLLDLRVSGARGLGTYNNGTKFTLKDQDNLGTKMRLGISKLINFSRDGDETALFHKLVPEFPNLRVFDSCFAYTAAITGGLDVVLDWNVKHWDVSASELLSTEAGGAIEKLKSPSGDKHFYGVLFGKTSAVAEVLAKVKPILDSLP